MVRSSPKRRTIFVNIAAYRDPECVATVRDLFDKAAHPDDVTACVVLQVEPEDNIILRGVRQLVVKASDGRGACWARSMGYRLWDGEDYVLQVDSHMRFAEHWDTKMLEQLGRCQSAKSVLTTYPPAYDPPGTDLPQQTIFLAALRMEADGRISQIGHIHNPPPPTPRPSALVAAGFIFGPAQWIAEVPYDPELYFLGEEPALAARLWTHGWDMFGPTEPLVWHWYNRGGRVPWQDDRSWHIRDAVSQARMRALLGLSPMSVDLGRYSLGSVRTFHAYQAYSGIDYAARTLAPHALTGDWA